TYTSVYTDYEPWRNYREESAETGSPGVIVYRYDGLPMQPVASPSPDYVPGPELLPSPDYVPDPEHPPLPVEIPYVPGMVMMSPPMMTMMMMILTMRMRSPLRTRRMTRRRSTSSGRLFWARKTVRLEPSMSASMEACIARHDALLSPPLLDKSSAIAAHDRTLEAHVAALIAQTSSLQTQLTTTLGCIEILEARDPEPQEGPTEVGSSCKRRQMTTLRECTYTDFLKCQPMSFQGIEGGSALTWWNSHMRAVGQDVVYAMPWAALKRMITDKYCPRGEILKLEFKVQGHYKSDCPKLKNGNQGNRAGNKNAVARAYVVGTAKTKPNSTVVTVKYHVVLICDEKLVRLPFDNKTLIFHGDRSNNRHESRLNIISYTKTQRYLLKGCPIFLAILSKILSKDKLKEKRLKQEHEEHVKLILELLKKEQLYAKFSKCEFWIPKVQFLGHMIDSQGIHVDPAKIESIKDWASLKTATEIHQFLEISLDEVHIDDKLCFIEETVEIMDCEVNRLKKSRIPIIKVRWNSRRGPEFT
nr:putative reverse transcriptase domain-containing protein [Tanacetum cinerariifolium]